MSEVSRTVLYRLASEALVPFFTALGVLLGGAMVGSLSSLFTGASPVHTMLEIAQRIKIFAVVVAIGGSFPTFRLLESGLFEGDLAGLARQLLLVVSALFGAQLGFWLIGSLFGGG